jgi:uncharacterized OsmC-like protein
MTTTASRTTSTLNGVDTDTLFATLDAVREEPSLGRFQFRAATSWVSAGAEHRHATDTVLHADHPPVLVGRDNGPTPAEYLLHALGACLTAGVGNIAAARGIELDEVTATIEGDIDLQGILGLDPTVRNGFEGIRVSFHVKGAAEAEQLAALVRQSKARSAVYDVLTRGVPVQVEVSAM